MDNWVAFLNARLDEEAGRANAMEHFTVPEQPYYSCAGSRTEPYGDLEWGEEHCDCFLASRKARALREVQAKRAILADYLKAADDLEDPWVTNALLTALDHHMAVWDDHPDYPAARKSLKEAYWTP